MFPLTRSGFQLGEFNILMDKRNVYDWVSVFAGALARQFIQHSRWITHTIDF